MIVEFQDTQDTFDHEKFQLWRRQNDGGFFVNVKSPNNLMLHRVTCNHHGDSNWERESETSWGSLTRSRKLCSGDVAELQKCVAEKYGAAELKKCADCKPV